MIQNRDPEENIILKKPSITFHARVIDECHVGIGVYPFLDSAYYVRIKPISKIEMFDKDGKKIISNKMIQIPQWLFNARKLTIPKKDSIIVVTGYYGQTRNLNFYFQILSYQNTEIEEKPAKYRYKCPKCGYYESDNSDAYESAKGHAELFHPEVFSNNEEY